MCALQINTLEYIADICLAHSHVLVARMVFIDLIHEYTHVQPPTACDN